MAVLDYGDLPPTDRLRADQWFEREVEPVLTPLAVDEGHPFPFISNLSTSLGVLVRVPGESVKQFARIKLPDGLPRMVPVPHNGPIGLTHDPNRIRFVPLWQLVEANLGAVFPGMEILDSALFRLTRGAGLETGEEDDDEPDLMSTVETELARRRFVGPVRLEMEPESSLELRSLLLDELGLPEGAVMVRTSPFEPAAYHQLADLPVLICNAKSGRPPYAPVERELRHVLDHPGWRPLRASPLRKLPRFRRTVRQRCRSRRQSGGNQTNAVPNHQRLPFHRELDPRGGSRKASCLLGRAACPI